MNAGRGLLSSALLAAGLGSLCQCTVFLGVSGLDVGSDASAEDPSDAHVADETGNAAEAARGADRGASREAGVFPDATDDSQTGDPQADSGTWGDPAPDAADAPLGMDAQADSSTPEDAAPGAADAPSATEAQADSSTPRDAAPDAAADAAEAGGDTYVLIDDMQSDNNKIVLGTGLWYAYDDGTTAGAETFHESTIGPARTVPAAFTSFTGATSTLAAELHGSGFASYAGMAFTFENPKAAFNASAYDGVVFWARVGSSSDATTFAFLVPDVNTDPQGSVCTKCYDYLGKIVTVTTSWQEFKVPFTSLRQSGFGVPAESTLAKTAIYGLSFQVITSSPSGQAFDLWVDDIYFYSGP